MHIDFCKQLPKCLIISASIILIGIIFTVLFGIDLDINFKGGSRFTYSYTGKVDTAAVDKTVEETIKQKADISENSDFSGDTKYLVVTLVKDEALSTDEQDSILTALQEKYADNNFELQDSSIVNPSIAGSFFVKSIAAVALAAIFVIIYIGIRFRKIGGVSAGVFAFVALIHDIIIAFMFTIIFRLQVDSNFIAVVLTILGYSLNDTIVVYDRVRENKKLYPKLSITENMNNSLNLSFTRTMMTSVATMLAVLIVLIVAEINGITTIRTFAIPMLFGLLSGWYSSVFISGPLWVRWKTFKESKSAKKAN